MRVAIDSNTVLSGLFFRGNERTLLLASLRKEVDLVFPEGVVDEVYAVVSETFGEHADLPDALRLLELVFAAGQLVPREAYERRVSHWARRLRDPTDAPLVACTIETDVEGLVTGDRDLLDLGEAVGIRLYRTREVLARLEEKD